MGKTRRCLLDLLLAALCVGLGLLLPWAFRWVHNGEQVLLLLQLPVLLCGMLCGPAYGLSCGLLIVLLPQLFPGAAGVALSTGELWELAIYGFLAGLLTYLLAAAPPVLNVLMSAIERLLEKPYYEFLSREQTIGHDGYNAQAQAFNQTLSAFPASLIGSLYGVEPLEYFR